MCEILLFIYLCLDVFRFVHLEATTHIDKEQKPTTIINKSNNLTLTDENSEDAETDKQINMKCTDLETEQNEESKK